MSENFTSQLQNALGEQYQAIATGDPEPRESENGPFNIVRAKVDINGRKYDVSAICADETQMAKGSTFTVQARLRNGTARFRAVEASVEAPTKPAAE